mmetsp:Transcript_39320/g.65286  ORF Transcript_39320/g.65286 Transcript_39320/m.65286 type:complete len:86 (+) Transcript_39320:68-325(+)
MPNPRRMTILTAVEVIFSCAAAAVQWHTYKRLQHTRRVAPDYDQEQWVGDRDHWHASGQTTVNPWKLERVGCLRPIAPQTPKHWE